MYTLTNLKQHNNNNQCLSTRVLTKIEQACAGWSLTEGTWRILVMRRNISDWNWTKKVGSSLMEHWSSERRKDTEDSRSKDGRESEKKQRDKEKGTCQIPEEKWRAEGVCLKNVRKGEIEKCGRRKRPFTLSLCPLHNYFFLPPLFLSHTHPP